MKKKAKPKHPRTPARTTAAVGRLMWAVFLDGSLVTHKTKHEAVDFLDHPEWLRDSKQWIGPVLVLPAGNEGVEELKEAILDAWFRPDSVQAIMRVLGIPPHAATGRGKK